MPPCTPIILVMVVRFETFEYFAILSSTFWTSLPYWFEKLHIYLLSTQVCAMHYILSQILTWHKVRQQFAADLRYWNSINSLFTIRKNDVIGKILVISALYETISKIKCILYLFSRPPCAILLPSPSLQHQAQELRIALAPYSDFRPHSKQKLVLEGRGSPCYLLLRLWFRESDSHWRLETGEKRAWCHASSATAMCGARRV